MCGMCKSLGYTLGGGPPRCAPFSSVLIRNVRKRAVREYPGLGLFKGLFVFIPDGFINLPHPHCFSSFCQTPTQGRLNRTVLSRISERQRAQKGVFYEKLAVYMGPVTGNINVVREVEKGPRSRN